MQPAFVVLVRVLLFGAMVCGGLGAARAQPTAPPVASPTPSPGSAPEPVTPPPWAAASESYALAERDLGAKQAEVASASGEDKLVLQEQLTDLRQARRDALGAYVDALVGTPADAQGRDEAVRRLIDLLTNDAQQLDREVTALDRAYTRTSVKRARARGEMLFDLADQLDDTNRALDRALETVALVLRQRAALGEEVGKAHARLDELLRGRAETLTGRLGWVDAEIARLNKRALASDTMKAERDEQIDVLRRTAEEATVSLKSCIALMQGRDLETAKLQQLLVERSGELSTELLDSKVALGVGKRLLGRAKRWLLDEGPQIILRLALFALILLAFRVLAAAVRWVIGRLMARSQSSSLLRQFVTTMAGRVVFLFGLALALNQLGVSFGPIIAGFGIVGLVVGIGLQDTLSNLASGIMVLIYRPFDIGDLIEVAGVGGHVSRMSLVSTTITSPDNQRLVIPNKTVWNGVIRNQTGEETRRIDLYVSVAETADFEKVRAELTDLVTGHTGVLADPKPTVRFVALRDKTLEFALQPWTKREDVANVQAELITEVKRLLDRDKVGVSVQRR